MHVHSFLVLVLQGLRKQLYMFLGAGAVNTNQITLSKEKPNLHMPFYGAEERDTRILVGSVASRRTEVSDLHWLLANTFPYATLVP